MSSRVTIFDVARRAGVAVSTVSHALRDEGTVSKKTCLRIQQVAQEMGYIPNPVIAAMGSRRTVNKTESQAPVAVLLRGLADAPATQSSIPRIGHARAERLGYRLEAFDLTRRRARDIQREIFSRGFVGVIINPLPGLATLPDFHWDHFSVVQRGVQTFPVPFSSVVHSAFEEVRVAWRQIRELGYRRIGAVIMRHDPEHPDDGARLGAILDQQFRLGPDEIAIPPLRCVIGSEMREFPKWMRRCRPDAVLSFHAGLKALAQPPERPPSKALGFAALNVHPDDLPLIAGVLDSVPEQFVKAVNLMDQLVRHHERGIPERPTSTLIKPEWVAGLSLPGPHQRRKHRAHSL